MQIGSTWDQTWVQGLGYLEIIRRVLVASNQQLRVTSYLSYTPCCESFSHELLEAAHSGLPIPYRPSRRCGLVGGAHLTKLGRAQAIAIEAIGLPVAHQKS